MPTPQFLRALIELAASDSLDELVSKTSLILERELGVRGYVDFFGHSGEPRVCGVATRETAQRAWIGMHRTIGIICLETRADAEDVELLARQLAPLAELLLERDAANAATIREEVARVYERRIRDGLVRHDWNASSVARELRVSRSPVLRASNVPFRELTIA